MNREKAEELIRQTPEYVPGPCPWCGAEDHEDAANKCRPMQMPCGDYTCGTPQEGPNSDNDTGPLYQRNPQYDQLDGYLWGWHAVDEGMTKIPPKWSEDDD